MYRITYNQINGECSGLLQLVTVSLRVAFSLVTIGGVEFIGIALQFPQSGCPGLCAATDGVLLILTVPSPSVPPPLFPAPVSKNLDYPRAFALYPSYFSALASPLVLLAFPVRLICYSLSVTNLKPIFPTISLDQPGKRCMDATWQSIVPSVAPEPNTTVHNTRLNNRYFKSGNFLTYNNIYHPDVLSVFLRAKNVIQDRIQDLLDTRSDSIEIAIAIRCISSSSPKVSYYIVDHAHKTVRWLDNSTPKCYHVNVDIQMRDSAEYWHHRSKFSVHRHCLQEDRVEVAALLNAMLGASQNDPDLDQEEIKQYIRRLENIPHYHRLQMIKQVLLPSFIAKRYNILYPHFIYLLHQLKTNFASPYSAGLLQEPFAPLVPAKREYISLE
ncbi:hypothetical protein RHS01_04524 [Rhizoctonia solani]|uniref:Uncharacterized protein n=1 Tax=Rhizoctonia solani TaxID=456999 RepID=A0A8H7M678_9AGAM|nr:hypothetical protein RHS01_04524 [Rhizoctonia solani]